MVDRKKLLLRKGAEIAKQLEELLAGKDVDLAQGIPKQLLPEKDPELRLRRFLEQIDRCIKRGRLGVCVVCDAALPDDVTDAAPWTERCAAHGF
jgi:RNA polymerase-binding transcription factor DksA